MIYASSKEALRRSLVGIATEIQGTAIDEVAYEIGTECFLGIRNPLFTQVLRSSRQGHSWYLNIIAFSSLHFTLLSLTLLFNII